MILKRLRPSQAKHINKGINTFNLCPNIRAQTLYEGLISLVDTPKNTCSFLGRQMLDYISMVPPVSTLNFGTCCKKKKSKENREGGWNLPEALLSRCQFDMSNRSRRLPDSSAMPTRLIHWASRDERGLWVGERRKQRCEEEERWRPAVRTSGPLGI